MKINNKHLGFDRNMSSPSHKQLFLIGNYESIANSEKKKQSKTYISLCKT